MSNGSVRRTSAVEPHATIGAQDLAKDQPDRCGFLRKRGQKERIMENLHLSRHVNWRQKYVVVKDNCCYCFSDELARSPQQTFSLQGYNRVFRFASDRAYFVFCLEPDDTTLRKMHTFAASTESERIAWMQTFRAGMASANEVQPSPINSYTSEDDADDIYIALEKPVYESPTSNPSIQGGGGINEDMSEEEEEGSDDSDYDVPDEEMLKAARQNQQQTLGRRNVPLPPVPQEHANPKPAAAPPTSPPAKREAAKAPRPQPPPPVGKPPPPGGSGDSGTARRTAQLPDARNRPGVPLPGMASPPHTLPKPKPTGAHPAPGPKGAPAKKHISRRFSEMDCLFDNSDREAALEIIRDSNTPGTFLIRKSRQGDSKVLVVMTAEDVKEYKIFVENGQVSLDKRTFFPSLDDLLNHYNTTPLPNRQTTLSRSYSTSSSDR